MLALAFLAGLVVSLKFAKKAGIASEVVLDVVIWVILSAIVGARTLYVILFWHEFRGDLLKMFMIQSGGLVFYGGLVLALVVMLWRIKKHGIPLLTAFDVATPGTALGYSIARIGCFLNGCCYGIETDFVCALQFPHLTGLRHPTQLYASATVFTIFLALLYLWKLKKFEGQIFLQGAVLYSIYRFLIEFIRVGPKLMLGLTASQWISILAFFLAGGFLIWKLRAKKERSS
jgi:phosphatidylglycerol:prolipoprotein diacylglycerol transferase